MKTILITGSTDGIGKLVAIQLAQQGHQLLIHGRNPEKLERTVAEIIEKTENNKIQGFVSDLSDFKSIESFVKQVTSTYESIDVLLNNAGVFKSKTEKNKQGLDIRFVVNYFAPYLLTNSLIPLLQKSTKPRIINLSSAAQAPVSLAALAGTQSLSQQEAYAQSKLALTMWSFYLAKIVTDISVIAVNPGSLLNTKMVQEAYGQYWSSADKGASILSDLATSKKYDDSSGKYFDNDNEAFANAHQNAYDSTMIQQLISTTDLILKK